MYASTLVLAMAAHGREVRDGGGEGDMLSKEKWCMPIQYVDYLEGCDNLLSSSPLDDRCKMHNNSVMWEI